MGSEMCIRDRRKKKGIESRDAPPLDSNGPSTHVPDTSSPNSVVETLGEGTAKAMHQHSAAVVALQAAARGAAARRSSSSRREEAAAAKAAAEEELSREATMDAAGSSHRSKATAAPNVAIDILAPPSSSKILHLAHPPSAFAGTPPYVPLLSDKDDVPLLSDMDGDAHLSPDYAPMAASPPPLSPQSTVPSAIDPWEREVITVEARVSGTKTRPWVKRLNELRAGLAAVRASAGATLQAWGSKVGLSSSDGGYGDSAVSYTHLTLPTILLV